MDASIGFVFSPIIMRTKISLGLNLISVMPIFCYGFITAH